MLLIFPKILSLSLYIFGGVLHILSHATYSPKIPLVQFSTKASTQTQCSSGVLLKHFTWFYFCLYPSHCWTTWYWTLRVHFLKSFSILFSLSCPHLRTGRWPPVPRRRERMALLVILPATSPTNLAISDPSAVGWRCTMKWVPSFVAGHSLENNSSFKSGLKIWNLEIRIYQKRLVLAGSL